MQEIISPLILRPSALQRGLKIYASLKQEDIPTLKVALESIE